MFEKGRNIAATGILAATGMLTLAGHHNTSILTAELPKPANIAKDSESILDILMEPGAEYFTAQEARNKLTELKGSRLIGFLSSSTAEFINTILIVNPHTGRDLIDELFYCLDADQDQKLSRKEITKLCDQVKGFTFDIDVKLPEQPEFAVNCKLSDELQMAFKLYWGQIVSLHTKISWL